MDFLIKFYVWGIAAELLFHLYCLIMYSFDFKERKTYQTNLEKAGLSWDPLYLKVYPLSDFKHTSARFWTITFLDLLGCLLSWYQVLYRVHKIMKVRQVNAMLTTEQKQTAFVLRNDPTLLKEEVIGKLTLLDPSLVVTEPEDQDRHIGYAKSSVDCFWCNNTIGPGEMVFYYGEPAARVPRTGKHAIFHYSCALTLDLYKDHSSSLTLYANLKERLEAGEKIKELILKDYPKIEDMDNRPRLPTLMEDIDKQRDGLMIEMAEIAILAQLLERLANAVDGEEKKGGLTKFITDLEHSAVPLSEFMAPLLERESKNPVALADILAALSEEANHSAAVFEIVRDAFFRAAKKFGWDHTISLPNVMRTLETIDDPVALETIKATAERALGKRDHPVIAALNARKEKIIA